MTYYQERQRQSEGSEGVTRRVGTKGSVTIWAALSYLLFHDWLRAEVGGAIDLSEQACERRNALPRTPSEVQIHHRKKHMRVTCKMRHRMTVQAYHDERDASSH